MPLMTSIRKNLSKAFGAFAAVFIIYIFLDWGLDVGNRKSNRYGGKSQTDAVGSVNGTDLTYREFSETYQSQLENYRQRAGEITDETERQIRNQVWNSFIQNTLLEQEAAKLGITVSDQEVIDIFKGPNPPAFIANQFRDSTGKFRQDAYEAAMREKSNAAAWAAAEQIVRRQRTLEKLQSVIFASVRATELEMKQRFMDKSISMETEYVQFDPNRLIPDSMVTVTDDDLQKYYNATQEEFKVKAGRKLKYISISTAPTAEDTAVIENEMKRFQEQSKSGSDFIDLAKTYSETPVNDSTFVKHGQMSRLVENEVFSSKKGQIVGPIKDFNGFTLTKVLEEKKGELEYVRASHILINLVSGPDSVAKIQKARDLLKRARTGEDFAKLARESSDDFGSRIYGGDLGWTGKGGWVKPFEQAAFSAGVGSVVGPVRSQFGWHIIKVTGKDNRELKLASLVMKIKASTQSIDAAMRRAQEFVDIAKEQGFEKAAEVTKNQAQEMTDFFVKGDYVPGFGINDAIMGFAFKNSQGEISDLISTNGGVAVFKIDAERAEGVRPLDEVKANIRFKVLREKKMIKLREQVEAFRKSLTPSASLVSAAQAMLNVATQKIGPFKAMDPIPGIGRDQAFIGAAYKVNIGEISTPIEGASGYFILKVLSRSAFDSIQYNAERVTLRDQITTEKRNRVFSEWLTSVRDRADIVDDRDKFYR
ncbi:MAG: peptidylprolyl isomerase [bacterium]